MYKQRLTIIISFLLLLVSAPVFAQPEKQTLTITPPMIKNNVAPGDVWRTYIKVVNNNSTEIEVYHEIKDFRGGTESGTVDFLASDLEGEHLLSNWITIEEESVLIPAFGSMEIPFIVVVPKDAVPGGHYAAILLGTRPLEDKAEGAVMKVSSMLASLILLNVDGDVEESGRIREFSTNKSLYTEPKVRFDVRFENTGNVHIQPQGEIRIYDWFGNDKGLMTINHGTEFGNVLPKTIRKWDFSWEGSNNLFEMGRYKASLILGFGENARQTISRDMYFWIINVKILLFTIMPILLFILIIILIIRVYIRRAIKRTREELGLVVESHTEVEEDEVLTENKKRIWPKFLLVTLVIMVFLIAIFSVVFYVSNKNNEYKEKYENNQNETLNPEPIDLDNIINRGKDSDNSVVVVPEINDEEILAEDEEEIYNGLFEVSVLNGSGKSGAAKHVAEMLMEDYSIGDIGNAEVYEYSYTFIKYKRGLGEEAKKLKEYFDEETEIEEDSEMNYDVVVIVGKEYEIK
jgi:hypothetical protein